MADRKISQATERATLDGAEQFPIGYNGNPFKVLLSTVKDWILSFFANKVVLDDLSDVGGKLYYDGAPVSESSASAGAYEEVQLADGGGGFLADALFKFDTTNKRLSAGWSLRHTDKNISIGTNALALISAGIKNIIIGDNTGANITTGSGNVIIGGEAGASIVTSDGNTIIGYNAATAFTGVSNVIIGLESGRQETTLNSRLIIESVNNSTKDYLISGDFQDRWIKFGGAELKRRINLTGTAPLETGTATSGSTTTLVDNSKSWTVNAYANKVVEITATTGLVYATYVTSNTATQLTFGNEMYVSVTAGATFKIIPTTLLTNSQLGSIIATDLTLGTYGIILPAVSSTFEGADITIYNETGNNGFKTWVVGNGTDLVAGAKFGSLIDKNEQVRIMQHVTTTNHWDLINQENIYRYWGGYLNTSETETSGTYVDLTSVWTETINKRFIGDGTINISYNSLVPTTVNVNCILSIYKAGAADVYVTFAKNGVTLTRFATVGRTSTQAPYVAIPVNGLIELEYGDYISVQIKTTASIEVQSGTLTIKA